MKKSEISSREWERLSTYLDGELSPKQQAELEARLSTSPELCKALDELSKTKAVLHSQRRLRAPRNFTLTPEMAGLRIYEHTATRYKTNIYNVLRFSSAVASFLFVTIVLLDFLVGGVSGLSPRAVFKEVREEVPVETTAIMEMPMVAAPHATAVVEAPVGEEAKVEAEEVEPTSVPLGRNDMGEAPPEMETLPLALAAPSMETSEAGLVVSPTIEVEPIEKGMEISPQPYPTPVQVEVEKQAMKAYPPPVRLESEGLMPSLSIWRILEVIFGILALGCGLTAFFMRQKGKM